MLGKPGDGQHGGDPPPWKFGALCKESLDPASFVACGGLYVLDRNTNPDVGLLGLRMRRDKKVYSDTTWLTVGMSSAASPAVATTAVIHSCAGKSILAS